jgi:hypothetical protein
MGTGNVTLKVCCDILVADHDRAVSKFRIQIVLVVNERFCCEGTERIRGRCAFPKRINSARLVTDIGRDCK